MFILTANYQETWRCISVIKGDGIPLPLPSSYSHPPTIQSTLTPVASLVASGFSLGLTSNKGSWYVCTKIFI